MENYFAYGHNVSQNNLYQRINKRKNGKLSILSDFRIVFNVRSKDYKKSYANIIPYKNDFVIGILYKLSKKDLDILDYYEDVDIGTYERIKVWVIVDEEYMEAWTYICRNEEWITDSLVPTKKYCRDIFDSIMKKL
jgi:gamma-glutamylcyclotransferase (GGCT)/AIG2-like uncharacterized protein YtfP